MRTVGIGLLGFGTVGAGVARALLEGAAPLAAKVGVRPELRGIADLDLATDRGVAVDRALLTDDAEALVDRPDVEVVVELIGGTGPARALVRRAMESGKPVVTANKALLAEHGAELFALAHDAGVDLYFGASVGGGIPIVRALREGLLANRIESIHGILNGTCNYILTRMEAEGLGFDRALAEAQARGYAEADPGLDIDGHDTAHKAALLGALAYGAPLPLDAVHVEGIRGLSIRDIGYAEELGYRVKLLAVIKRAGEAVDARVHPTLLARDHVLASVSGVFNAVMVVGDLTGPTLYYGRGAGREPTAATVVADVADVMRNLAAGAPRRLPIDAGAASVKVCEVSGIDSRYYLRLSLLDRPGVLAQIAAILGRQGISIASVLQKEVCEGGHVPVLIVTHAAREAAFDAALSEIDALDCVGAETVRLRIED